jgi:hypothetical protein
MIVPNKGINVFLFPYNKAMMHGHMNVKSPLTLFSVIEETIPIFNTVCKMSGYTILLSDLPQ